jgi:hypothetical protein
MIYTLIDNIYAFTYTLIYTFTYTLIDNIYTFINILISINTHL